MVSPYRKAPKTRGAAKKPAAPRAAPKRGAMPKKAAPRAAYPNRTAPKKAAPTKATPSKRRESPGVRDPRTVLTPGQWRTRSAQGPGPSGGYRFIHGGSYAPRMTGPRTSGRVNPNRVQELRVGGRTIPNPGNPYGLDYPGRGSKALSGSEIGPTGPRRLNNGLAPENGEFFKGANGLTPGARARTAAQRRRRGTTRYTI
jgi:hypothetical protein